VFIDIFLELCSVELQVDVLQCSTYAEAEYRHTASPQANKTGARSEVANFPFPGIMGVQNRIKDKENEKICRQAAREDGKNPEQHDSV
jgi:hypothetical protein